MRIRQALSLASITTDACQYEKKKRNGTEAPTCRLHWIFLEFLLYSKDKKITYFHSATKITSMRLQYVEHYETFNAHW